MNRLVSSLFMFVFFAFTLQGQDEIPVIAQEHIPAAVNIEDADADFPTVTKVNSNATTVTTKSTKKVNLSSRVRVKNVYTGTLSADRTNMYFIQLAAVYQSNGDIVEFKRLGVFGNIYKHFAGNAVKIKLGYFQDRNEAKDILRQIKSMGYRDAFITQHKINSPDLELAFTGSHYIQDTQDNVIGTSISSAKASYKVRLESYQDAVWFSSASVDDLGKIEQWTKGSWTIFVLSAYNSLEEAMKVKDIAVQRGFNNAEVVLDNNGILEKVAY